MRCAGGEGGEEAEGGDVGGRRRVVEGVLARAMAQKGQVVVGGGEGGIRCRWWWW